MDSQQAKQILASYRPNSADAQDPLYVEALAQARRDPELARWLIQQQAVDAALRRKFSEIPAPPALKAQILASHRVVRPSIWKVRPALVGWAAAVVLMGVVYLWSQPKPVIGFDTYRENMTKLVAGDYRMMFKSRDQNAIRQYLASHHGQADYALSAAEEQLPGEGCAVIDWHGKKATLVCFDLGHDNDLYLFVASNGTIPESPGECLQYATVGPMTTAAWTRGDKTYLLALKGDAETLRKYQ